MSIGISSPIPVHKSDARSIADSMIASMHGTLMKPKFIAGSGTAMPVRRHLTKSVFKFTFEMPTG